MKPIPTFGFLDEPQYRAPESREYVAHLLRAYRRSRDVHGRRIHILRVVQPGRYFITRRGCDATADIRTRG